MIKILRKIVLPPANVGDIPNPPDPHFVDADEIRLVNDASAYTFKEARLTTRGGGHMDNNKYPGQLSLIMRVLTSEDRDLISYFDKIIENEIKNLSLKQSLINNHTLLANKGRVTGQLQLEHFFFGFCKNFKKKTSPKD